MDKLFLILYLFYFILFTTFINNCSSIKNTNHETAKLSEKYFIGFAETDDFHKKVKEILLDYDYHIEQYENLPTESLIITHWKVRDPTPTELENGFIDAKTKLFIRGMVDNQSYTINNSFSYECILEYKNQLYNGKEYVDYRGPSFFKFEIEEIVETFLKHFKQSS